MVRKEPSKIIKSDIYLFIPDKDSRPIRAVSINREPWFLYRDIVRPMQFNDIFGTILTNFVDKVDKKIDHAVNYGLDNRLENLINLSGVASLAKVRENSEANKFYWLLASEVYFRWKRFIK